MEKKRRRRRRRRKSVRSSVVLDPIDFHCIDENSLNILQNKSSAKQIVTQVWNIRVCK